MTREERAERAIATANVLLVNGVLCSDERRALVSRIKVGDASAMFLMEAKALEFARGGRPAASLETVDGREQIVFTYPDGTKTCGGRRVN